MKEALDALVKQYKAGEKFIHLADNDPNAHALATAVAGAGYAPDPAWVLDICQTEGNDYHLLEIGGFSFANLAEALEKMRKDGVKVTDEIRTAANGKIKYAFIEGPDKIRIELIEGHPTKE